MGDGHASLRARSLLLGLARHAHGCDDRLHLWRGFDPDVLRLFALRTTQEISCIRATILSRRVKRPSPRHSSLDSFLQTAGHFVAALRTHSVSSLRQCLPQYTLQPIPSPLTSAPPLTTCT